VYSRSRLLSGPVCAYHDADVVESRPTSDERRWVRVVLTREDGWRSENPDLPWMRECSARELMGDANCNDAITTREEARQTRERRRATQWVGIGRLGRRRRAGQGMEGRALGREKVHSRLGLVTSPLAEHAAEGN
jgi:hypothetical protein